MACAKPSTCNCVCTQTTVSGLTYNGINYDAQNVKLVPTVYPLPDPGCSCVLSRTVAMKRTGSGSPGIFDNLTIRVELHDNCIMYAEATLAVPDNPVWSGRCTSINGFNCDNRRFSCGITGAGGGIVMSSRTVFGNNVTLTIDGDMCVSWLYEPCTQNLAPKSWLYEPCIRP